VQKSFCVLIGALFFISSVLAGAGSIAYLAPCGISEEDLLLDWVSTAEYHSQLVYDLADLELKRRFGRGEIPQGPSVVEGKVELTIEEAMAEKRRGIAFSAEKLKRLGSGGCSSLPLTKKAERSVAFNQRIIRGIQDQIREDDCSSTGTGASAEELVRCLSVRLLREYEVRDLRIENAETRVRDLFWQRKASGSTGNERAPSFENPTAIVLTVPDKVAVSGGLLGTEGGGSLEHGGENRLAATSVETLQKQDLQGEGADIRMAYSPPCNGDNLAAWKRAAQAHSKALLEVNLAEIQYNLESGSQAEDFSPIRSNNETQQENERVRRREFVHSLEVKLHQREQEQHQAWKRLSSLSGGACSRPVSAEARQSMEKAQAEISYYQNRIYNKICEPHSPVHSYEGLKRCLASDIRDELAISLARLRYFEILTKDWVRHHRRAKGEIGRRWDSLRSSSRWLSGFNCTPMDRDLSKQDRIECLNTWARGRHTIRLGKIDISEIVAKAGT
jgi:hypothetical protein